MPDHVGGDALAEVRLEAVHTLVEQRLELPGVPVAGGRAGEVDQPHAGLPQVPLPDVAVRPAHQVPEGGGLVEQRGLLGDVGVDPGADPQPLGLEPGEHAVGVREDVRVPLEVAPLVLAHPEAVEVEDGERDAALGHAVHEGRHGLLVVRRGEGRGEPQAEGPGGRQGGAAGEGGVAGEDVLGGGPGDDVVLQRLVLDAELHLADGLGADLEGDGAGVVDEDAVAARGEVERDVLVRLLAAGAAVGLPHVDDLAVLDERGEALAEAVDLLADAEGEAAEHVVGAVAGGGEGGALGVGAGQLASVRVVEGEAPGPLPVQAEGERTAGQLGDGAVLTDLAGPVRRAGEGEVGAGPALAGVVGDADADDTLGGREALDREERRVERVPPPRHLLHGGMGGEALRLGTYIAYLGGVREMHTLADEPEAVGELHDLPRVGRELSDGEHGGRLTAF